MKKFLESLPIVILFLSLLVPAALFGQWFLFAVFFVFGLIFAVIEVIAQKVTGNTISQQIWALKRRNPKAVYIITGFMVLAWGLLITHFLWHN